MLFVLVGISALLLPLVCASPPLSPVLPCHPVVPRPCSILSAALWLSVVFLVCLLIVERHQPTILAQTLAVLHVFELMCLLLQARPVVDYPVNLFYAVASAALRKKLDRSDPANLRWFTPWLGGEFRSKLLGEPPLGAGLLPKPRSRKPFVMSSLNGIRKPGGVGSSNGIPGDRLKPGPKSPGLKPFGSALKLGPKAPGSN